MMQNTHHSDGLQVALLTVHIDQETVEQIRQTAARMPWELINVDYGNYFSGAKVTPFTQRAMSAQACVAVVDFDDDPERALETAEFLRQSFHLNIGILALSAITDPDLLLRAMRAGYSEFLGRPFDLEEFTETLNRLDHRWENTMVRPRHTGKILSFFGAKGGVGTTTLAVHLAMFLVRNQGKRVLLIDNHAQLGTWCFTSAWMGAIITSTTWCRTSAGWTRTCCADSLPRTPAAWTFYRLPTFMAAPGKRIPFCRTNTGVPGHPVRLRSAGL